MYILIQDEDVWVTVLAMACLNSRFVNEREEWEMVEQKARQWMDGQKMKMEGRSLQELIEEASGMMNHK